MTNLGESENVHRLVGQFHFFGIVDSIDGQHSLSDVEVLRGIRSDQTILCKGQSIPSPVRSLEETDFAFRERPRSTFGRRCDSFVQLESTLLNASPSCERLPGC